MTNASSGTKEPFIRISKRTSIGKCNAWGIRIVALLLSLIVSGLIIYAIEIGRAHV